MSRCRPRVSLALVAALLTTTAGSVIASPIHAQTIVVRYEPAADSVFDAAARALVDSIAQPALDEIAAALPGVPDTVRLVIAVGPQVIDVTGEVGGAMAPGEVRWTVNPSHPRGLAGIVRASLRLMLFHEVHHLVRGWTFRGGTPPRHILDAAIAEGMASVFARDVAGAHATWATPPDDVAAWFEELRALPRAELMRYNQWMFDHPDGRRWIGYRTGTWIVDRAIARSGGSAVTLVRTPPDEVLRLAGLPTFTP
jgi:hypothetical protein